MKSETFRNFCRPNSCACCQEREIKPLGDTRTRAVDVRVISSTNRDLQEKIAQGEFREDLFYRINVISIRMPSLREIREDIPILAVHFLNQYIKEAGLPSKILSPRSDLRSHGGPLERQRPGSCKTSSNERPPSLRKEVIRPERFDLDAPPSPLLNDRGKSLSEMPYRHGREQILKRFHGRLHQGPAGQDRGQRQRRRPA